MTITVIEELENSLTISEDGIRKYVPRDLSNATYKKIIGEIYQDIERDNINYIAFPFTQVIGTYVYVVYSWGDAHALSDRQKMARKPIASITDDAVDWEVVDFHIYEGDVYNTTLLDDVMSNGDTYVFKYLIATKAAGVVSLQQVTTVTVSGYSDPDIDGTYALWSKPRLYAGKYYRSGYATYSSGSEWNSVLFESTDQITWTIKGVLAKGIGASKKYNEADIVETTAGNYLAIIREDTGANRPLYTAVSSDLITWTSLTLSTAFNGTQPNLLKLASGTILLGVGDRAGSSGIDASGDIIYGPNKTGITVYRSEDNGSTWSSGTLIDASWSTDCGQPFIEEYSSGNLFCAYYSSIARSTILEPGVRAKCFIENNIT